MAEFTIHFDGSCWPNPGGQAAYGMTLDKYGVEICTEAGVTGSGPLMSNNVAEFDALRVGLQRYLEQSPEKGDIIHVFGDSNLVVKMMQGDYRPNSSKLYYPYYKEAFKLYSQIEITIGAKVDFTWIPRERNTRCDALSKEHNKAPK